MRRHLGIGSLVLAFIVFLALNVYLRQALLFVIGLGLGAVLAGARFGFTTGWRQLIEDKNPQGLAGQLVLLALAAAAALPLLASSSDLRPALGPISISLLIGAFVFGVVMQIADGCGSGTLYKAGLGIPLNMGILPLFAVGSFLGSVHLQAWLGLGQAAPIALVSHSEASASSPLTAAAIPLLITFTFLLLLALAARWWVGAGKVWWSKRWLWGALGLAVLATANLVVAGQPWGVVYGFGLWAAKLANVSGLFDPTLNAFWSDTNQARHLSESVLLDVTSITNIGILAGAFWVHRNQAETSKALSIKQWLIALVAGFLMGYSSRLAFGCNVGAMLSGISTGSIHGWVWVVMAFSGSVLGVRLRRRWGFAS